MKFLIRCECGKSMTVSQGSAGALIPCDCGRTIDVPSLEILRTNAGLSPVDVPLKIEVEWLVKNGDLPTAECVGCGAMGAEAFLLFADCEQVYVHNSGESSNWATALIFGVLTGGRVFAWYEGDPVLHGRETVIPVPARFCDSCRYRILRSPSTSITDFARICIMVSMFIAVFATHWAVPAVLFLCWHVLGIRKLKLRTEYRKQLKSAMSTVPIYELIFNKFPDATVTTGNGGYFAT